VVSAEQKLTTGAEQRQDLRLRAAPVTAVLAGEHGSHEVRPRRGHLVMSLRQAALVFQSGADVARPLQNARREGRGPCRCPQGRMRKTPHLDLIVPAGHAVPVHRQVTRVSIDATGHGGMVLDPGVIARLVGATAAPGESVDPGDPLAA
jgi:hypothetical protein